MVPILHGQPYLDKPPLLYWLLMGSYRIFGVADWAARLVPGLAGVLTVLIAYLWGRRVVGHRAALWGAVVLCLSARFVYLGRMVTMDGLLCLCITASLATGHIAILGDRLRLALVAGVGVVLCPRRARQGTGGTCSRRGASAALPIPGPSLSALVVGRLAGICGDRRRAFRPLVCGSRSDGGRLRQLLLLDAPCSALRGRVRPRRAGLVLRSRFAPRPAAVDAAAAGLCPLPRPAFRSLGGARSAALGFFLLAFAAGFLFFSASACKRPAYILPALPPLALALGCYLDQVTAGLSLLKLQGLIWGRSRRLALPAAVLALTVGIGGVGVAVVVRLLPFSTGMLLTGGGVAAIAVLGAGAESRHLAGLCRRHVWTTVCRHSGPAAGVQQAASACEPSFGPC